MLALLLICALAGATSPAQAQPQGKTYRIAYLSPAPLPNSHYQAFREGLRALGYIAGGNVAFDARSADGNRDRVPQLAAELASTNPDVIVVPTGVSALAAKKATTTIPIVMAGSSDAVAMGIVKSLGRPGTNVTGLTINSPELAPKRLELLAQLPNTARIVVLWCPWTAINQEEWKRTGAAAAKLGLTVTAVEYRQGGMPFEEYQRLLLKARPNALFLLDCTVLPLRELEQFAMQQRIPLMTPYIVRGAEGALLAYGADTLRNARRAAAYVDKILKGARPADLPVEQPTEYEFVVNLKSARAIGMTVPQSLLLRATRVIE